MLALVVAAGCATAGPRELDPEATLATVRPTADNVLARWDRAATSNEITVYQPLGAFRQVGDWEPALGDSKAALLAGLVEAAGALPAAPDRRDVRLHDGRTRPVRPLSAAETLDRAKRLAMRDAPSACPTCSPLRVAGARLVSAALGTVGGRATAPAWELRLEGSAVRLVAVAVPDSAVTELEAFGRPEGQNAGSWIERADPVDGPALAVVFPAAPYGADKPCGADYTGEAVESARAVVVLLATIRYYEKEGPDDCPAGVQQLTIPLRRPLGDRVVLQLFTGVPVEKMG
ncbi:hypothetical protein Afe04nite_62290 [Asanoa ferruginea]|nr:hypothetical protein Afe04nite_62290 [Asanoa ferruginea]